MVNSSAGKYNDPITIDSFEQVSSWEDVDNADIVYQLGKNNFFGPFVVMDKDRQLLCHVNFLIKNKIGYTFRSIHIGGWVRKVDSHCC